MRRRTRVTENTFNGASVLSVWPTMSLWTRLGRPIGTLKNASEGLMISARSTKLRR